MALNTLTPTDIATAKREGKERKYLELLTNDRFFCRNDWYEFFDMTCGLPEKIEVFERPAHEDTLIQERDVWISCAPAQFFRQDFSLRTFASLCDIGSIELDVCDDFNIKKLFNQHEAYYLPGYVSVVNVASRRPAGLVPAGNIMLLFLQIASKYLDSIDIPYRLARCGVNPGCTFFTISLTCSNEIQKITISRAEHDSYMTLPTFGRW